MNYFSLFIPKAINGLFQQITSYKYCHLASIGSNTPSFQFHNTLRVIPPVALIPISPGITLLCDQFSISVLPTHVKSFLSILDTSLTNTSANHTIDLLPTLITNSTQWQKLPAISKFPSNHRVRHQYHKTITARPKSSTSSSSSVLFPSISYSYSDDFCH